MSFGTNKVKMGCCGRLMAGPARKHHFRSMIWVKGKAICKNNEAHPDYDPRPPRKHKFTKINICTANDRGRNL